MKTLNTALNFSTNFKIFHVSEITKAVSHLPGNKSDIVIGDFFLRYDRSVVADFSTTYHVSELCSIQCSMGKTLRAFRVFFTESLLEKLSSYTLLIQRFNSHI